LCGTTGTGYQIANLKHLGIQLVSSLWVSDHSKPGGTGFPTPDVNGLKHPLGFLCLPVNHDKPLAKISMRLRFLPFNSDRENSTPRHWDTGFPSCKYLGAAAENSSSGDLTACLKFVVFWCDGQSGRVFKQE
jgi:hypothetical protein